MKLNLTVLAVLGLVQMSTNAMLLQNASIAVDSTYSYGALTGTVTSLGAGNVIGNVFDGEWNTVIRGVGDTAMRQPYAQVVWTTPKDISRLWMQHGNHLYSGEGYKLQTFNGSTWDDIPGAAQAAGSYTPGTEIWKSFDVSLNTSLGIRYQMTEDNPTWSGWVMRLDDLYLWNRDVEDPTVNLAAAADLTVSSFYSDFSISANVHDQKPMTYQDLLVANAVGNPPLYDPALIIDFEWAEERWIEGMYYLPSFTSLRQMAGLRVYTLEDGLWIERAGPLTVSKELGAVRMLTFDFGISVLTSGLRVTFDEPIPNGQSNSSYIQMGEFIISAGTPIPEPASLLLLAGGVGWMLLRRRR